MVHNVLLRRRRRRRACGQREQTAGARRVVVSGHAVVRGVPAEPASRAGRPAARGARVGRGGGQGAARPLHQHHSAMFGIAPGWLTSACVELRNARRASGEVLLPLAISANGGPDRFATTWHGEQTFAASSSPARLSLASSAQDAAHVPTAAAIAREAHKNPAPRVEGLVPVFDIMAHITYPGKSFATISICRDHLNERPKRRTGRLTQKPRRSRRTGARVCEGPGLASPSRREGSIHVYQAH